MQTAVKINKKKAEDEKQTDVRVKDGKACGISQWKHGNPRFGSRHYLESIFKIFITIIPQNIPTTARVKQ